MEGIVKLFFRIHFIMAVSNRKIRPFRLGPPNGIHQVTDLFDKLGCSAKHVVAKLGYLALFDSCSSAR
ncbi:hypothetical protein DES34_103446 [Brevibacillus brevis]|nr:hypothetical protein DES34_103446 [Brevibacillus brevis]VEF90799.1 Uncharacterised protein [Brevibacillus brevis]